MAFVDRFRSLLATPLALGWWAYVAARLRLVARKPARIANSVALLAWDFPPNASTGAHLPASFARHAADAGWQVTVICGPGPETPTTAGLELMGSVPRKVRICRVTRLLAGEHRAHLWRAWLLPKVDGGFQNSLALVHTAIAALSDDPPAVVMASGPRFCNFVAARLIAEAFGARLLLQYRDEWTVNTPAFVDARGNDRREEARCLERADIVSFVTTGKRDIYRRAFPTIDPRKYIVTPNGWEPYVQAQARTNTSHLPREVYAITYTGRCHVSLAPLLKCVAAFVEDYPRRAKNVRLVLVGGQLPLNTPLLTAFERDYPGVLLNLPAVTPREAIEIQRESAVLLLINDYMYDGIIPLKTFEYLCGTQPVLVFGLTGGAARIVEETRSGLSVAAGDAEGFAEALSAFASDPHRWNGRERQAWRERHNRKKLVREMLAAISKEQTANAGETSVQDGWNRNLRTESPAGRR